MEDTCTMHGFEMVFRWKIYAPYINLQLSHVTAATYNNNIIYTRYLAMNIEAACMHVCMYIGSMRCL